MATNVLEKGRRIAGADRDRIRREIVKEYEKGATIRDLVQSTGRSYGFIHKLLDEAQVPRRPRGFIPGERSKKDGGAGGGAPSRAGRGRAAGRHH